MNTGKEGKEAKEAGAGKQAGGQVPVQQQQGGTRQAGEERGLERRGMRGLGPGRSLFLGLPELGFGFGMSSPFELMRRMMEDFSGLSGGFAWTPSVDVFEREGQLVVRADLPGMKREDIRVELLDEGLLLEGERKEEHEAEEGGVWRSERRYGSFRRLIPLPEELDLQQTTASFKDGVLEVCVGMPERKEKAKGRRIEISEGAQAGKVKH